MVPPPGSVGKMGRRNRETRVILDLELKSNVRAARASCARTGSAQGGAGPSTSSGQGPSTGSGQRPKSVLRVVTLGFALFGLIGCDSQSVRPTAKELSDVNTLVGDRVGKPIDAQQLLDTDPRVPPPAPEGELTLEEAIDRALSHNLALVASAENLTLARAALVQAGLIQNPTLSQNSGTLFAISPTSPATAFDFAIAQVINSILTQPAKVAQAKIQSTQASIDLAAQAFALAEQAQTKYQEMVHTQRSTKLAVRVEELYRRAVQAAEARQKVGIVPTPEVNRARLQYEDARRQVQHLHTQYARAAREMNWLMGVAAPPHWTLPAVAIEEPPSLPPPPESDALEEVALKYRLDLRRAKLDLEVGRQGVELARKGLVPEIQLGVDGGRDNGRNYFLGPYFNITVPIFDPGIVALHAAEAQQRKFDKTYVALQGQVRQDVRTAFDNWRIAADDVRFFRERLIPQQEKNVQLMELSFRLGNDDLDSLLNVYHDYVAAQQSYEDAIQAYQDASVAVQEAVGLAWARMLTQAGIAAQTLPTTAPATQPTTVPATAATTVPAMSATTVPTTENSEKRIGQ
jgi:cobalt-zinc-cadmium efflux system outer membrane protein